MKECKVCECGVCISDEYATFIVVLDGVQLPVYYPKGDIEWSKI